MCMVHGAPGMVASLTALSGIPVNQSHMISATLVILCAQAYYRRADAKLALGKFAQALKDFKLAAKVAPCDPDLKRKLAECEKEHQRLRFEKALRSGAHLIVYADHVFNES